MTVRISPRVALLIIAAMFVLPLVAAWLMYSGVIDYRPGTTRNLGELVTPPRPIDWGEAVAQEDADDLLSHWTVLHVLESACGPECIETVTALRQVHRAAGRYQARIRLALLLPEQADADLVNRLHAVYGEFRLLEDPSGSLRQAAAGIASPATGPAGSSYLVDPLGNIMMHYAAGYDPNDLKKDLKRLLTWSKLDK